MYVITLSSNNPNFITDVLGTAILYDTNCDQNNSKAMQLEEDRIITNRNISSNGETFQLLYLRKNDKSAPIFDNDEREFDRDFDRYAMLNKVVSEEYDRMNQIPINNCVAWNVNKHVAEPTYILSTVTEALTRSEVRNVKTIVAIVNAKDASPGFASIYEVSINEGQIYVNKLSSAMLNKMPYE